jgi:hypothetical protein
MYQFIVLIIGKLFDLMTLKLDGVEANVTPGFQKGFEESLQLFPFLVLLEVFFDLLLARIFSFHHVIELSYQMICEFDYRIEMPQLYQGNILVDAYLHYREGLLVSFHILERCDHIIEGLSSY